MEKIILTTFTDPMMGLSYEQEPVYEKLAEHYGNRLGFKYVMSGLVRDVSDFMLPEELALPSDEGIRVYNRRLAQIYKDEESIGGLPINMHGFHLFDTEHRSSYPLCIAYKAAQLCDPEKADAYLLRLRRATIVETRQTTKTDELAAVAIEVGLDQTQFRKHFEDGSAEEAFRSDLQMTCLLGIHSLPFCLVECGGKSVLVNGMIGFLSFVSIINDAISAMEKIAKKERRSAL